jgi:two-component system response regulator DctR
MNDEIRVLIAEDDPMVMEIYRKFLTSIEGFCVAGQAPNGKTALKILRERRVDLLILDIFMPELNGIETLKAIRARGDGVDVIVISAAQEIETVNQVIRAGAFDYIVKPFVFERFRAALESYRLFFERITKGYKKCTQKEVDDLYRLKKKTSTSHLPKGLNALTLEKVRKLLEEEGRPVSAESAADAIGVSRVTARRYLEYLAAQGETVVERSYGDVGRPVNTYKLIR